jgi:hypothetical protein
MRPLSTNENFRFRDRSCVLAMPVTFCRDETQQEEKAGRLVHKHPVTSASAYELSGGGRHRTKQESSGRVIIVYRNSYSH